MPHPERQQSPREQAFWLAMVAVNIVKRSMGEDIPYLSAKVSEAMRLPELIEELERVKQERDRYKRAIFSDPLQPRPILPRAPHSPPPV